MVKTCTKCGAKEASSVNPTTGLVFTTEGSGSSRVVTVSSETNKDDDNITKGVLIIPSKVLLPGETEAVSINEIGDFSECSITELYIAEGPKEINMGSFDKCVLLEKAHIPETVTTISANAFVDCYALNEIKLPAESNIANSVLMHCYSLRIVSPASLLTATNKALFKDCNLIVAKYGFTYDD